MNRRTLALATIACVFLAAAPALATDVYKIDATHSGVNFKIRHLVSKVSGRFDKFSGTISVNPDDLSQSSVELTIETASIDTDNENRDNHLRSADFFDAENNPQITFKSTKVEKGEGDTYMVTGDFTMRGVTKSITIPVEVLGFGPHPSGAKAAGFESNFELNRKDYGVNWNKVLDAGGYLLDDEVEVDITIEALMKP